MSRKTIRPIVDFDEIEDEQRRDLFGRKRVEVIQCLLDSSSEDSNDDIFYQNSNSILWLTFAEICHIRTVLAQAKFNEKKDSSKCFRCRESIRSYFFFSSKNVFICYICQQKFCKNCTIMNFYPPFLKQSFPVRTQTLIKITTNPTENPFNQQNQRWKTICYDCSQIFNEYKRNSSVYSRKPSTIEILQTFVANLNRARCLGNEDTIMTVSSIKTKF